MTIDGIYMATIEMEKERGAGRLICVAAPPLWSSCHCCDKYSIIHCSMYGVHQFK